MDAPNVVVTVFGLLIGVALIVRFAIRWYFREKANQLRDMMELDVKEVKDEKENHKR
jgi:hypothetical protein